MDQMRPPGQRTGRAAQQRTDFAKQGEAQRIVGPVPARGVMIRPAFARIEVGTIHRDNRNASGEISRPQAQRRKTRHSISRHQFPQIIEARQQRRVTGGQHFYIQAQAPQRRGQGCADIGKTSGLDQWREFRGDKEDAEVGGGAVLQDVLLDRFQSEVKDNTDHGRKAQFHRVEMRFAAGRRAG